MKVHLPPEPLSRNNKKYLKIKKLNLTQSIRVPLPIVWERSNYIYETLKFSCKCLLNCRFEYVHAQRYSCLDAEEMMRFHSVTFMATP